MPQTDGRDFDWDSEEGKQATARLNRLLQRMDETARKGSVRAAVPLGISVERILDENGEVFGFIAWRKPAKGKNGKGNG